MTYRKIHFDAAFDLLQKLKADPYTALPLLELQKILLREILRAEEYQNKIKAQQVETTTRLRKGRPPKELSKKLKQRLAQLEDRLTAYKNLAYYWRLFGEAAIFTYLDKHAIKHAYFNTDNTLVRQSAGHISGKEGLLGEIALVEEAINDGIPAILTDLTNSIRHGDVCLLGGSDPYLIEVKNGQHLGERGRKQVAAIEKLHQFYENDVAELRGFPNLRRREAHSQEVTYTQELNTCIKEARKSGTSLINPERGLYYIATCEDEPPITELIAPLNLGRAVFYGLNEAKYERAWSPYKPFTLSIEDKDDLYAFLRGEFFLIVVLDTTVLCELMSEPDNSASFEFGEDYPLVLGKRGSDNYFGVSQHFINRIAYEFVSPAWIVDAQKHLKARVKEELESEK